jgi:hypothetical protein
VTDGFGLRARQIDASAAFARWRDEYRSRVDAAFDGLLGPGLDASHDRAIARELFALAKPWGRADEDWTAMLLLLEDLSKADHIPPALPANPAERKPTKP